VQTALNKSKLAGDLFHLIWNAITPKTHTKKIIIFFKTTKVVDFD